MSDDFNIPIDGMPEDEEQRARALAAIQSRSGPLSGWTTHEGGWQTRPGEELPEGYGAWVASREDKARRGQLGTPDGEGTPNNPLSRMVDDATGESEYQERKYRRGQEIQHGKRWYQMQAEGDTRSAEQKMRELEQQVADPSQHLGGLTPEAQWQYNQAVLDTLAAERPELEDLIASYGSEDEQKYMPGASEFQDLELPGEGRDAQMQALTGLQDIISGEGLTDADRARMQLARGEAANWMSQQRAANEQAMRARGIAGGGAELAGMMGAQSSAAQTLNQQDLAMQVQAQDRALQAMQSAGQLGGSMRGEDRAAAYGRAASLDSFNQWAAQQQRDAYQRNMGRRDKESDNRAQAYRDRYGMKEREIAQRTEQYQGVAAAQSRENAEAAAKAEETKGVLNALSAVGTAVIG